MTRKEEAIRESMKRYPDSPERGFGTGDYEYPESHDDEREAFIEGAEWADKSMIDRACKWLLNINYDDLCYRDFCEGFNEELFVNDFRKAMEE